MNIREFLELHSSRVNADILADKMIEEPGVLDEVWNIMLEGNRQVSMRAAWAITVLSKKDPKYIQPRVSEIIDRLPEMGSGSVLRSLLNLLTMVELPEEQSGFLFDYCIGVLESPEKAIAHKAYSMTILYNISEMEPDLKPELIEILETQSEENSSGIKSRCATLLRHLQKDIASRIGE